MESLRLSIPAPRPDEDAASLYAQIADKRSTDELDGWFNDIAGNPAEPAAAPQNQGAGAQNDASGGVDPAGDEIAPAAVSGGEEAEGEEDQGWGDMAGEFASAAFKVGKDVAGGLAEAPRQVVGGVVDALGEVDQAMQSLLPIGGVQLFDDDGNFDPSLIDAAKMKENEKAGEDLFSMIAPADADTTTGGFVRSAAQFLTGFIPGVKALGGAAMLKNAPIMTSAAAGLIADMVVFDPHEDRLSTFLNEVPALEAVVPDYLADNNPANESEWEGRLKNGMEGLGLGLATDVLLRTFKYYKAQRAASADRKLALNPVGAKEQAARDQMKAAAREELVNDIPDEALAPLGDASGPLLIEAKPDETIVQATTRMKEAATRAALSVENNAALSKINEIREKFAQRAKDAGRDPVDQMLDELRGRGPTKAAGNQPKRPVGAIVRKLGGVDPTSSLAGDLRSRGVTAQSFPGLFRKGGLRSLDNIPASEHPLFMARDGATDGATGYVSEGAFVDALESELKGDPWRTPDEVREFEEIIGPIDELDEQLSRLGIDYENMSNDAVKARMLAIEEEESLIRLREETPPNMGDDALSDSVLDEDVEVKADVAPLADDTVAPPLAKGRVFINHARINTSDDVKAVIQQMADMDEDAIKAKTRGVVSNAQTIRESSTEYRDLNDLIGRPPGPMTAAQAVAARRLLTSSGEQIVHLAQKASAPDASKADLFNFRRAMAVHYAIQSEVVAARTETARALQSWTIPAGATKARTQAITDLITAQGGAGDLQALAKAVATADGNPTALNAMARELGRGKFGKAMYQVWINGLLSSPKTHAVNIMSNAMVALYAIPERYVAAGISKAFYGGEVDAGETAAMAFGMIKGIRDGARLATMGNRAEGMADLSDVFDTFVKTDQMHGNAISAEAFGLKSEGGFGYGIDMLGKFINLPGSALAAEDKFFKTMSYRMELNALAYRQASSEGLEGKDFASRVVDILNNPPESLKVEAIDAAHYNTFTQKLGKNGQAFQLLVARTPMLKVVVPFIRTPTNILKYTFARTPLAYLSGAVRADIAAGGARAAQTHARVAMGTMVMMTIADMTTEGTITGGGPINPEVRKAWLDAGNQPYSVKVGDRWFSYSRADPIGMMMGLSADTASVLSDADQEDGGMLVTAGALAIASNLANKTYMSGIYDFIAAVDPSNPTSDIGKYLGDQAGGLVPYSSFLRNVTQTMDPVQRDTRAVAFNDDGTVDPIAGYMESLINKIKRGIPGQSDTLPPMRDLWGDDITRASGLGWGYDFISPLASKADDPDPVSKLLLDNKVQISAAPRQINGVRLTPEEYADFVREAGAPAREYLTEFVKSPGFQRLSDGPDGMKAEILKDVINNFRDRARAAMMQRNPELRERVFLKDVEKRKMLTGQ